MKRTLTVIVMAIVVGFTAVANARNLNLNLKPKSPAKATTLSLVGTLVPTTLGVFLIGSGNGLKTGAVLILVGTTLGPSRGHDYAGNNRQAMTGFLMRTGFWLGGLFVAAVVSNDGRSDSGTESTWFSGKIGPSEAQIAVIVAAAGLVSISALYDIAAAARSAREYNRKHGFGGLSVAPTFDFDRGGAGVKLSWKF